MQELQLTRQAEVVNELLARYGVKFGIYKNNVFKEQSGYLRNQSCGG